MIYHLLSTGLFHPNSWYYHLSFTDEDTQAREADQFAQGHEAEPSLWLPSPSHYITFQQLQRGFYSVLISARAKVGYGKTPRIKREILFWFCHFPSERPWASHFPFLNMFPHLSDREESLCPPLQRRAMQIKEVTEKKTLWNTKAKAKYRESMLQMFTICVPEHTHAYALQWNNIGAHTTTCVHGGEQLLPSQ